MSGQAASIATGRFPSNLTRKQLARSIRDDLRAREAERRTLMQDLGREVARLAQGGGDQLRLPDIEALLAEVERAIRLDPAALEYLG